MDTPDKTDDAELTRLEQAVARTPDDYAPWLERGKHYLQRGLHAQALNDFIEAARLCEGGCPEAEAYIAMLREIFAFRHTDLYNP